MLLVPERHESCAAVINDGREMLVTVRVLPEEVRRRFASLSSIPVK